jgi:CheY-like chemotaxis protein
VDDSQDGREMLVEYLVFRGFSVSEATHGQQAIDVARRLLPDIILMDLSMPGMDGWEATRRLKTDPDTKNSILIAVTAHAFPAERTLAYEAGAMASSLNRMSWRFSPMRSTTSSHRDSGLRRNRNGITPAPRKRSSRVRRY